MDGSQFAHQNGPMPPIWNLDQPHTSLALQPSAVSALLDVTLSPASADALLRAVQTVVPVDYLSLVSIRRGRPELIEGGASRPHERPVVTHCFGIYRHHGYYRHDAILPLAQQMDGPCARHGVALHCRADELPDAGWRADIYERERLTDRFTLMHAPAPGQVQAIHLYRDERQGRFLPQELERLLGISPLLRQAHAAAWRTSTALADRSSCLTEAERRLRCLAPALSVRECQVCARIALGHSADGIATDLDVAPSTVVTLRKRAYLKLAQAGLPAQRLGLVRLLS